MDRELADHGRGHELHVLTLGTSHSGAEFAGKIRTAGSNLKQSKQKAVKAGAQRAQRVFATAPGVPHTVDHKKVVVSLRMVGDDAIVRYTGAAHLVNNPTKPHLIRPKQFLGTRGSGKRVQKGASLLAAFGLDAHSGRGGIKLKDGGIRRSVMHKGTKGKHFFQHAVPVARKSAVSEMRKVAVGEATKVFK